MPRKRKKRRRRRVSRKPEDVKRRLMIAERGIQSLEKNKSGYVKNMLKFGFASWFFGISTFVFALMVVNVELFGGAPPVWASLLVGAPAAPVTIAAMFVHKFDTKIRRLERIRRGLMTKYRKAVLRDIWER